jgi:glycosyltransferase involved in cell wall biosynthesis
MSVEVSVIVPVYNPGDAIGRCLQPLLEQLPESPSHELIVVDNNSSDNTAVTLQQLAPRYPQLRLLFESVPGAGAARNTGIKSAQGELLIFLDDDVHVQPDHIQRHWQFHQQQTAHCCLVVQVQDHATFVDSWALQSYVRARQATTAREPDLGQSVGIHLASGNFSIHRSTLEAIRFEANGRLQYFDETFTKRQDGELGYRLEQAGVPLSFTSHIQAEHWQTYTRQSFMRRAYLSGYYLQKIFAKHPEAVQTVPSKNTTSPFMNRLLLIASKIGYPVGSFLQSQTTWLLHRAVGMQLLYYSNQGFQDAYYGRPVRS